MERTIDTANATLSAATARREAAADEYFSGRVESRAALTAAEEEEREAMRLAADEDERAARCTRCGAHHVTNAGWCFGTTEHRGSGHEGARVEGLLCPDCAGEIERW